jgi:hypothetical protein
VKKIVVLCLMLCACVDLDPALMPDNLRILDAPDAGAPGEVAEPPEDLRIFCPGPLCYDTCDVPHPDPCTCDITPKPGCPTYPDTVG